MTFQAHRWPNSQQRTFLRNGAGWEARSAIQGAISENGGVEWRFADSWAAEAPTQRAADSPVVSLEGCKAEINFLRAKRRSNQHCVENERCNHDVAKLACYLSILRSPSCLPRLFCRALVTVEAPVVLALQVVPTQLAVRMPALGEYSKVHA